MMPTKNRPFRTATNLMVILGLLLSLVPTDQVSALVTAIGASQAQTKALAPLPGHRQERINLQPGAPGSFNMIFNYDSNDNLVSMVNARGRVNNFAYDANHNLTSLADGYSNHVTRFSYDSSGNVASIASANGQTSRFVRDSYGNPVAIQDARGFTTTQSFDGASRPISITDALGQSIGFQYDDNDNLTEITTPVSTVKYEYDANGRMILAADATGQATHYVYDETDNLVQVVDAKGHAASYSYDTYDNLISSTDPNRHTTLYKYDQLGRLIQETDPLSNTAAFEYDPNGNVIKKTDAEGQKTLFAYDPFNRLTHVSPSDGAVISYTYDANGNMTAVTTTAGVLSFKYDLLDQLAATVDSKGKKIEYEYDPVGNLSTVTYPPSNDFFSNLKATFGDRHQVSYRYDPDNRLATLSVKGNTQYTFDFLYDPAGRLTAVGPGLQATGGSTSGVIGRYDYDAASWLTSLKWTSPDGNVTIRGLAYTYDAAGNVLSVADDQGTTTYAYDEVYRLVGVTYPNGNSESYTYDAAGNRVEKKHSTAGSATYVYNEANQLVRSSDDAEYVYDKNGNLKTKKVGGQVTTYTWNDQNRLIRIDYPDGTYSSYTYDALGRRTSKTDRQGKTIYYLYDGANLVQELNADGLVLASYVYGDAIDHPYSMTRDGKTYFYIYDRLNSVIGLTDGQGNSIASYRYDPWGNLIEEQAQIENPFRFTGREWDAESGLYFYRARYYDPTIGRFISKDPLPDLLGLLPNLNRYIYVRNDPANRQDPYGLQSAPCYFCSHDFSNWSRIGSIFNPQTALEWYAQRAAQNRAAGRPVRAAVQDLLGGYVASWTGIKPQSQAQAWWATGLVVAQFGMGFIRGGVGAFVGLYGAARTTSNVTFGIPYAWETGDAVPLVSGSIAALGSAAGFAAKELETGIHLLYPRGQYLFSFAREVQTARIALRAVSIEAGAFGVLRPTYKAATFAPPGGILLNKSAQVFTSLTDITSATYDPATQQLILIGRQNLALPPMNLDDFIVAVRSVYANQDPGVSIDPGPTDKEMAVRYLGPTEGTEFGRVMFEADRLLKTLSMGRDNMTQAKITSTVPGFKSELDLNVENLKPETQFNAWHRMWFLPKAMNLKKTADGQAMVFDKASLELKTEYLPPYQNLKDPAAQAFVTFMTVRYDDLAKERPELQELRQLAMIVSVVKWLKGNNIPVDFSWLDNHPVEKVSTPKTTPAQTVWSDPIRKGLLLHKVGLTGGVDFAFQNRYIPDDGTATAFREQALQSRPEGAVAWQFKAKDQTYQAVALSLAQTRQPGGYRQVQTGFSPAISSVYDSFAADQSGLLGHGWTLVPYRLSFPRPDSVYQGTGANAGEWRHRVVLNDIPLGQAYGYSLARDVSGNLAYWPDDPTLAPKLTRNQDGTYSATSADHLRFNFDKTGRLLSQVDRNNNRISFNYEGQRLARITDSYDRAITISYDVNGRISKTVDPIGRTTQYDYDRDGNLVGVVDARGNRSTYVYDADHQLIKVIDPMNQVIQQNTYDQSGRLIRQVDAKGRTFKLTYDGKSRRVVATDPDGKQITWDYDEQYRLIKETDSLGKSLSYEYGAGQYPVRAVDRRGNSIYLGYDSQGNVTKISSAPLPRLESQVVSATSGPTPKSTGSRTPTMPGTYEERAAQFRAERKYDEAIKLYQAAIAANPDTPVVGRAGILISETYEEWAADLRKEGKHEEAITKYKIILDKYDYTPLGSFVPSLLAETYLEWANRLRADAKFSEAMTAYQTLLSKYSDKPAGLQAARLIAETNLEWGRYLLAQSQFMEAMDKFTQLQTFTDDPKLIAAAKQGYQDAVWALSQDTGTQGTQVIRQAWEEVSQGSRATSPAIGLVKKNEPSRVWFRGPEFRVPNDLEAKYPGHFRFAVFFEEGTSTIARCRYRPSGTVIREKVWWRVALRDTRTGQIAYQQTFDGSEPEECHLTESFGFGDEIVRTGDPPTSAQVTSWLSTLVLPIIVASPMPPSMPVPTVTPTPSRTPTPPPSLTPRPTRTATAEPSLGPLTLEVSLSTIRREDNGTCTAQFLLHASGGAGTYTYFYIDSRRRTHQISPPNRGDDYTYSIFELSPPDSLWKLDFMVRSGSKQPQEVTASLSLDPSQLQCP